MIGAGDLAEGRTLPAIVDDYGRLLARLKTELPGTPVFLHSLPPINETLSPKRGPRSNPDVIALNNEIKRLAAENGYTYVDLAAKLTDADGRLPSELTLDGFHLNESGYRIWRYELRQLVK
jgi:lysophospholipase L1-like esterase